MDPAKNGAGARRATTRQTLCKSCNESRLCSTRLPASTENVHVLVRTRGYVDSVHKVLTCLSTQGAERMPHRLESHSRVVAPKIVCAHHDLCLSMQGRYGNDNGHEQACLHLAHPLELSRRSSRGATTELASDHVPVSLVSGEMQSSGVLESFESLVHLSSLGIIYGRNGDAVVP